MFPEVYTTFSKEHFMIITRLFLTFSLCAVSIFAAGHNVPKVNKHHQPVQVTWLGHAAFEIVSSGGTDLLIDPFIKGNPSTPEKCKDLSLYKPSAILITHSHGDHLGDAVEIAKLSGAPVVITYDMASTLGLDNVIACNLGGCITIGDVKIHVVPATHGSARDGYAFGYVLTFEDGQSLYHTGDTWISADMGFIQALYHPNILLTCVGGGPYTQDPATAALEARTILFPSVIVPMHFATWPGLATEQDVRDAFQMDPRLTIMVPGETRSF
jgi:L-ascorbate metabolism protein UlaG (beta-lactamase superfamily)